MAVAWVVTGLSGPTEGPAIPGHPPRSPCADSPAQTPATPPGEREYKASVRGCRPQVVTGRSVACGGPQILEHHHAIGRLADADNGCPA